MPIFQLLRRLRQARMRVLYGWIAVFILLILLSITAVSFSWVWLHGYGDSNSATLRNIGLVIAAIIALPLALWRSAVAERQADAAQRQSEIAMQNLLNERFQKGAEMLGHPDIGSVRIGGIHALARLASEHPHSFHLPVMQLFAAFVVDRTRTDPATRGKSAVSIPFDGKEPVGFDVGHSTDDLYDLFRVADRAVGPVPVLAKDIEEIMQTISQRDVGQAVLERENDFRMNLADVSLPGIIFHNADFSYFDFTKADLRRARGWRACLSNATLPGADLSGANMHGVKFRDADMRRVNLTAARLEGSDLRDADLGLVDRVGQNLWRGKRFPSRLVCVRLTGADLRGADFGHADMRGASLGCTKADGAEFSRSIMVGADLRAASLRDAKFIGANLTNANLVLHHLCIDG